MDLSGLDVTYYVNIEFYNETKDEANKPSKLLKEKVIKKNLVEKQSKVGINISIKIVHLEVSNVINIIQNKRAFTFREYII